MPDPNSDGSNGHSPNENGNRNGNGNGNGDEHGNSVAGFDARPPSEEHDVGEADPDASLEMIRPVEPDAGDTIFYLPTNDFADGILYELRELVPAPVERQDDLEHPYYVVCTRFRVTRILSGDPSNTIIRVVEDDTIHLSVSRVNTLFDIGSASDLESYPVVQLGPSMTPSMSDPTDQFPSPQLPEREFRTYQVLR